MKNFIIEINGHYNHTMFYSVLDSLCKEKKWNVLHKAKLPGEGLCRSENDYKSGGIFYGLFLAPKTKYVSTIDKCGTVQEHKTSKGFNDSERPLDRSQNVKTIGGKKICGVA